MSRIDWSQIAMNALLIIGGTLVLTGFATLLQIEFSMLVAFICAAIPTVAVIIWRSREDHPAQPRHRRVEEDA